MKELSQIWQNKTPDGEFKTFDSWVNNATWRIGGKNALCLDAKDRVCEIGKHFMMARDEAAFPIRYYFGLGQNTAVEQRRLQRLAARKLRRIT